MGKNSIAGILTYIAQFPPALYCVEAVLQLKQQFVCIIIVVDMYDNEWIWGQVLLHASFKVRPKLALCCY